MNIALTQLLTYVHLRTDLAYDTEKPQQSFQNFNGTSVELDSCEDMLAET